MFTSLSYGLNALLSPRYLLPGLLFALVELLHAAPHQGPVPPLISGYGSWGSEVVAPPMSFDFTTQGHVNRVYLYHPENQTVPAPTVFFAPGWNVPCQGYVELFRFLVSKGHVAVCDEYNTDIAVIGAQLRDAFMEASSRYPALIDTRRIGLAGHSSGAGLLGSLAYELVRNQGWGGNGAFIFSSAPWIDFDMTDAKLADFPQQVKLIVQTYEEDASTDIRTYIQQFEPIPVPDSEKEFIMLRPERLQAYDYAADHRVIATGDGYGVHDAMDDFGVFRLLDALADYSFTGSPAAWRVALGNGADEQIEMGALPDLVSTDDPRPIPGKVYDYPCDYSGNPRRASCADFDDELPGAVLWQPVKQIVINTPNPLFVWEPVISAESYFLQIRPLLDNGEPDLNTSYAMGGITPGEAGCGDEVALCQYPLAQALPRGSRYAWWIRADSVQRQGVWSRRGAFTLSQAALFTDGFE